MQIGFAEEGLPLPAFPSSQSEDNCDSNGSKESAPPSDQQATSSDLNDKTDQEAVVEDQAIPITEATFDWGVHSCSVADSNTWEAADWAAGSNEQQNDEVADVKEATLSSQPDLEFSDDDDDFGDFGTAGSVPETSVVPDLSPEAVWDQHFSQVSRCCQTTSR